MMNANTINAWFSENIYHRSTSLEALTIEELWLLLAAVDDMEQDLADFAQRTLITRSDRILSWTGYVMTFAGPATLLTTLSPISIPLTIAGTAVSAYQFLRDRQKALDAAWCEARMAELKRFSKAINDRLRAIHGR